MSTYKPYLEGTPTLLRGCPYFLCGSGASLGSVASLQSALNRVRSTHRAHRPGGLPDPKPPDHSEASSLLLPTSTRCRPQLHKGPRTQGFLSPLPEDSPFP